MRRYNIVNGPVYHGLPLYLCELGHHSEILDRIEIMLDYACYRHNKVFFMRIDVHFPKDRTNNPSQPLFELDNTIFERFITKFIAQLRDQRLDAHCLWAREQKHGEAQQHYHCVFLMDGNKTQNISGHMTLAKETWGTILKSTPAGAEYIQRRIEELKERAKAEGKENEDLEAPASPLIDHCDRDRGPDMSRNGIMLRRGDPKFQAVYNECFRWASYLAKADTKGMAPKDVNEFSSSRIPPPPVWRKQDAGDILSLEAAMSLIP